MKKTIEAKELPTHMEHEVNGLVSVEENVFPGDVFGAFILKKQWAYCNGRFYNISPNPRVMLYLADQPTKKYFFD